jgi:hypothetical protein
MACSIRRLNVESLLKDRDQVSGVGPVEEHHVVVDAVEGMIAFLLVNSVARLSIDFEDVRDDPSFG